MAHGVFKPKKRQENRDEKLVKQFVKHKQDRKRGHNQFQDVDPNTKRW